MKPERDPEQAELNHLIKACNLGGKDLLEIGCGDGKFIRQYAGVPHAIVGVDPSADDLQAAIQAGTVQNKRVWLIQSEGEHLPFKSHSFDIAIFASSL